MAADISRVRFDPLRDIAGVVLQQGRLLLDADFNELVALIDRRLRAETSDLTSFGPDPGEAGVAWVPRQTEHAFEIALSGGTLSIGQGRMYVDGLLAENHGKPPDGFDALLSERTGTDDTPYDKQPYWLTPASFPTGGLQLAYLDVWQRELTHLQDPGLVEVAVGVDTTARLQTAWQVRLLPVPAGTTCNFDDDDIPAWSNLIRPSDGRLSTHEVDVDPADDPCEVPPAGGYRGLENQTYRVEIHEGGAAGTATFKWSRENASVAMPVVEVVSATKLRLASVGKDDVLRVSTGDWVEIIDDRRELNGDLGVMRQVTVDDAARTITFSDSLPGDLHPMTGAQAAERHLRVRRWDSPGLITVPDAATTKVTLEHGIAVSFSLAPATNARFRRGDHWIFAARTADADFERLEDAPPLGVHHHYARLAIVNPAGGKPSDCRRLWPPLPTEGGGESCDCTVCVSPESHESGALTVQDAIDQVKELGGGTVCLAAGVYDIGAGVQVDGMVSLRIRGQGVATMLFARGRALTVTGSIGVTVENLTVVSGAAEGGAIRLQNVGLATLQDLAVLSYGSSDLGGSAVELAGVGLIVGLRRNLLVARNAVTVGGGEQLGLLGAALRVEDNVVLASERGIDLGGTAAYFFDCRVARNDVLGPNGAGIVATGAVVPGGSLEVAANRIAGGGSGIEVGADALVDGNTIHALVDETGEDVGGDGIVVTESALPVDPGHVRITGNRVRDRAGTGIALRTSVVTFMVKQNVLERVGQGIAIEGKGQAERVAVEDNEVLDVLARGGEQPFSVGIFVANAGSAAVVGNTVARVAAEPQEVVEAAGIVVGTTEDVRVAGNVVDEIAPQDGYDGLAAGIAVIGTFERASVSDNSARFGPDRPGPELGRWWALLVQSVGAVQARMGAGSAVPLEDGGAVMVNRDAIFAVGKRGDHAGVSSNTLTGGGEQPACLVQVAGDVVAEGNQCLYVLREDPSAVVLAGSSVVASANRVRGDRSMLIIKTQENRLAAVGNLAAGGTHLGGPGAGLPSPWNPLNPHVP